MTESRGRALLPGFPRGLSTRRLGADGKCRASISGSAVVCTARGGEGGKRRSYRRGGAVCRGNVPKAGWYAVGNRAGSGSGGRTRPQEHDFPPGVSAGVAENK